MADEVIVERHLNALLSKVNYIFNKPVSSSDLNEVQTIINNNVLNYLQGSNFSNSRFSADTTITGNSMTINGFSYLHSEEVNSVNESFFGYASCVNDSQTLVELTLPAPSADSIINLYIYYRVVQLNNDSEIYYNGIRTNSSQTGITESILDNNIFDEYLDMLVSTRLALEVTFYLGEGSVTIDGWSNYFELGELSAVETEEGSGTYEWGYSNKDDGISQSITNINNFINQLKDDLSGDLKVNNIIATGNTLGFSKNANVTLTADGWNGSVAPYTQVISDVQIVDSSEVIPIIGLSKSSDPAIAKSEQDSWNFVSKIESGENSLTASCYEKKPIVDLNLIVLVVN